jgi:DNA replication protein DnaC
MDGRALKQPGGVQALAVGVDFEAYAAERRKFHERHQWHDYEPSANERAELERTIANGWSKELEQRKRDQEQRLYDVLDRFPRRAFEAARVADESASAIAQLRAWSASSSDGIVVLAGPPGTGKTTAATWWALQQKVSIPEFLRANDFATMSRYDDARDRWLDATQLVLDDLGAEYLDPKGSFNVEIDALIDSHYAERGTLIITTNCSADEFRQRYGERVVDRLREAGSWITVTGPSLRKRATAKGARNA